MYNGILVVVFANDGVLVSSPLDTCPSNTYNV